MLEIVQLCLYFSGARSAQAIVDSALSQLRSLVNGRLSGKKGSKKSGGGGGGVSVLINM